MSSVCHRMPRDYRERRDRALWASVCGCLAGVVEIAYTGNGSKEPRALRGHALSAGYREGLLGASEGAPVSAAPLCAWGGRTGIRTLGGWLGPHASISDAQSAALPPARWWRRGWAHRRLRAQGSCAAANAASGSWCGRDRSGGRFGAADRQRVRGGSKIAPALIFTWRRAHLLVMAFPACTVTPGRSFALREW